MLGKRLINTGGAGACTTDTVQILDAGSTQSTALYRFEDNANDTAYTVGSIVSSDKELDLDANGYSGSGDWQDTSGNNRHATVNGATYTNDGNSDYFDFNGSSDYAETTFTENWASIPFSVEMWFNTDSRNGEYLWGLNESSSMAYGVGASVRGSGNSYHLQFLGSGLIVSAGPVETGRWYHLVFTSDGTTKKAYLDGELKGTGTTTINSAANGKPFIFGRYGTYNGGYFNGKIAQVRIYSVAMSAAQVKTNYDATRALYAANHGTADSNVTYSTGKFGKAAVFTGVGGASGPGNTGLITLPDNSNFDLGASTSLSFWAKRTSTTCHIINKGSPESYAFWWGTNYYLTLYNSSGSSTSLITSTSNTTDTWYHFVITVDSAGTGFKLYMDGNLEASSTFGPIRTNTGDVRIGSYTNGTYTFGGSIDQIRWFDKTLNSGEINTLYNETATSAASGTIDNPSTVAYYKMADASDETGSYNGTATNVDFNFQGKYGFAGKFNGSNSKLVIPSDFGLTADDLPLTFSAWINFDSLIANGDFRALVGSQTSARGPIAINMYGTSSGAITASLERYNNGGQYYNSGYNSNAALFTYVPGTWYHIVFSYSTGRNVSVYINGSQSGITNPTYNLGVANSQASQNETTIGLYGSSGYGWIGKIDQVRIFNKAISAAEVTTLYNEVQCANTITTPEDYFQTKLYTGTGASQSITGVGFQPDFTWIKSRSHGTNHELHDSVRGEFSRLFSDSTSAAGTTANGFVSLASDGFNLDGAGGGGEVNTNTRTYAAWNWKAGGITNKSALFNGSNSNITLPITTNYSDLSMSCWVKFNALPTGNADATLMWKGFYTSGTNTQYLHLRYEDYTDQFKFAIRNNNAYNQQAASGVTATVGVWYHVVGTLDSSGNAQIYVNGNAGTGITAAPTMTNNNNFEIGSYASSTAVTNGFIDQVRIFNKELSAAEVTTLYNEPSSKINTLQVLGDTSCIAAYPLGINANDLDTSTPQNGTASNVVFNNPGHLTRNNNGTIESTVSASQESGFSIVKYTGNNTSGATVGHGLSSAPELMVVKRLDTASDWDVYTSATGATKYLILDTSQAVLTASNIWNNTAPSSTVFTVGNHSSVNASSGEYIAYCFANVDGYQRIGSYIGTGTPENFIYTGFEPAWVLIKNTSTASTNWVIVDNKRDNADEWLYPNTYTGAYDDGNTYTKFYANGFSVANNGSYVNTSGDSYIFLAVAANPDTTAPTKANSFKTVLYNGTGSSQSITGTGFKPDLTWIKNRANGVTNSWHTITDSVRGGGTRLWPNATNAEAADNYDVLSFQNDGFTIGTGTYSSYSGGSFVSWSWKGSDHDRNLATINYDGSATSLVSANPAAGFSVVKWTGTGVDGTKIGHGLQGSPEMIITKGLSNATSWVIGVGNISGLSINDYFTFTGYAKANSSTFYQAYSTNTFQVGVSAANEMNKNSSNQYISYCFRTIAGHSKVGKYTGTGVSGLEIPLDFSPSFLLVKGAGATGWIIIDNQRPTPGGNYELYPHLSNSEDTSATSYLLGTNKFTVNSTGTWHNINGTDYIYLAIK